jgi:hypothetical protein
MTKRVRITPVRLDEPDLDALAAALLEVVNGLDEPTLLGLAAEGQKLATRLTLPQPRLHKRESAA